MPEFIDRAKEVTENLSYALRRRFNRKRKVERAILPKDFTQLEVAQFIAES